MLQQTGTYSGAMWHKMLLFKMVDTNARTEAKTFKSIDFGTSEWQLVEMIEDCCNDLGQKSPFDACQ